MRNMKRVNPESGYVAVSLLNVGASDAVVTRISGLPTDLR